MAVSKVDEVLVQVFWGVMEGLWIELLVMLLRRVVDLVLEVVDHCLPLFYLLIKAQSIIH